MKVSTIDHLGMLLLSGVLGASLGCARAANGIGTGTAQPDHVPLVLLNDAQEGVCSVSIVASGGAWDRGRMGRREQLEPGRMRTFFVQRGRYDLLVQGCSGSTVSSARDLHLDGPLALSATRLTPFAGGAEILRGTGDPSPPPADPAAAPTSGGLTIGN